MKKIIKKLLMICIMFLCSIVAIGNLNVFGATVIPTDYTIISTNSTIDITSDMENNFGVFRFSNYGSRFVEITLEATSEDGSVSYPTGAFSVKNSDYQLIKKCDISGYQSYAINNNINSLSVFLTSSNYYYIEVNYIMTDITKLELTVKVVNNSTTINMFNYSDSAEFSLDMLSNATFGDKIKQFTLNQSGNFEIKFLNSTILNNGYRIVLLKRDSNHVNAGLDILINQVNYSNYSQVLNLSEGTYYIGYFELFEDANVNISINRRITSYGSSYLIPDPDQYTNCGSQITVAERDTSISNRSYRQTGITEGFTRLIYLENSSPSLSRLDYYWYSSDESIATVTNYGTVFAMPISTSSETVKIMAVYKYDMSKTYVKEFTVYNDTKTYLSDPIDIYIDMTIGACQYTYIDMSKTDVPINVLQYYMWSTTNSNAIVDGWGRMYPYSASLGTTINFTGVYQYNQRVKIHVNSFVVLQLSGYELDYDTSLWDDDVQNNNNCYAYAINNQVYPGTNTLWFKQQPGEFADSMEFEYSNEEKMRAAVLADFEKYNERFGTNLSFTPIGKYQKSEAGTYKVALVANSNNWDYHWYRQDSDGYWSHKPGTTQLTRYDNSGNLIIDPENCERGIYDLFLGFYSVTGWNNMYEENNTILYYSNSFNNIKGSNDIVIVSESLLNNITVGMNIDDVVSTLGSVGRSSGSGAIIHEYTTHNNETIRLYYKLNTNNYYEVAKIVRS